MCTILLIYNAKSGSINTFFDIGHKLLSPETYSCSLCALTHDTFTENKTWKAFRKNTDIQVKFFHIDEFTEAYPNVNFEYPSILIEENSKLKTLLTSREIKNIKRVEDLISSIETKCFQYN